jgi:hypothetical protein
MALYRWFSIEVLDGYFYILGIALFFSGIATQYVSFTAQSYIAIDRNLVLRQVCISSMVVFVLASMFSYLGDQGNQGSYYLSMLICVQASLIVMMSMYSAVLNVEGRFKLAILLNPAVKILMIIVILISSSLVVLQWTMICSFFVFGLLGFLNLRSHRFDEIVMRSARTLPNKLDDSNSDLSRKFSPFAVFCLLPFSASPIIDSFLSVAWADGELATINLVRRIEIALASLITIPYMGMFSRAVTFEVVQMKPILYRVFASLIIGWSLFFLIFWYELIPLSLVSEEMDNELFYELYFWLCFSIPAMVSCVFMYRYFSGTHRFGLLCLVSSVWFLTYFGVVYCYGNSSVGSIQGYSISWIVVFSMLTVLFIRRGKIWQLA